MIKVDTTTLSDVISKCFDQATDGRYTDEQQTAFLADGKRLRGLLMNLLSAQFNDGTQRVVDANASVKAVNAQLTASAANLAATSQMLSDIANLVGTLDGLLNIAASFI